MPGEQLAPFEPGPDLPASEIDLPGVDDDVSRDEDHALVVGHGRVDVRWSDSHPIAHRDGGIRIGRKGRVLVGAEPQPSAFERRVAVVHAQRLEPTVRAREPLRD